MRDRLVFVGLWSLIAGGAVAQTEIHRCAGEDGTVIYSQMPCNSDAVPESGDVVEDPATEAERDSDDGNPDTVPGDSRQDDGMLTRTAEFTVTVPLDAAPDESCQKKYRDAIDEIDAEMRREYTVEKSEQYKERLLALTAKLRQC